jgi:ABC-type uncharacterized transport system fused permease/ATPase subunit
LPSRARLARLTCRRAARQLLDEVGCTVLSVGNRPSLVPFHSKVLRLTGNQEWRLEDPQDAAVGKAAGVESEESA